MPKQKLTAKLRGSRRLRSEDTKTSMSPEMLPKSFGTFGKRAPGRFSLNNSNGVLNNILGQGGHLADKPGLRVRVVSSWAQFTRIAKVRRGGPYRMFSARVSARTSLKFVQSLIAQ